MLAYKAAAVVSDEIGKAVGGADGDERAFDADVHHQGAADGSEGTLL